MTEYSIKTWQKHLEHQGVNSLHALETECWAPWLAASPSSMQARAEVFPAGQLCVVAGKTALASLSLNKIQWNGDPQALPSWDQVAGDPTDYAQTFVADGNTLCLMSMNVGESARGLQMPKLLIERVKEYAAQSGVENIIGSFRPSAYGQAILSAAQSDLQIPSFEDYVSSINAKDEPIDPWLRSLSKNGMNQLAIDPQAMVVPITAEEFQAFKQPTWKLIEMNGQKVWASGQTGFFYPQVDGSYIYQEKNVWGRISNG